MSVTTDCGIKARPTEGEWETIPIEDYKLEEAADPVWDLGWLDDWGVIWSPVPISSPIPVL